MSAEDQNNAEAQRALVSLLGEARAQELLGEARALVLWSGAADAVLWSNAAAADLFRIEHGQTLVVSAATPGMARLRSFGRTAATGDRLAETLRFFVGSRLEGLKTETLRLALGAQGPALITVFGAGPSLDVDAEPPAPPLPAPHLSEPPVAISHASAATQPLLKSAAERGSRFIFLTDPAGTLLSLSAAFTRLTGSDTSMLIGQPLADIIADIDPAQGAAMARAMLGRKDWSGIEIDWPGENGEMPRIALSAAAVFDSERAFLGYNGVGTLLPPGPATIAPAHADQTEVLADRESRQSTPTTHVAEIETALAAHLTEPQDVADGSADVTADELADARDAAVQVEHPAAPVAVTTDVSHAAIEQAAEAPAATLTDEVAGEQVVAEPEPPKQDFSKSTSAKHDPARQDNAPANPIVVPLRNMAGSVGASLGETKVVPLKPARPTDHGLTHSERNAFREIAKALGARVDGEDEAKPASPVVATPEAPAPVARIPGPAVTPPDHSVQSPAHENRVAAAQAEISKALKAAFDHAPVETPAATPAPAEPKKYVRDALGDILIERVPVGVLVFRGDKPIYMNRPLLDLLGYEDIKEFEALRGLEKLFRGRAAPSFSNGEYDTITIMGRDGETLPADAHLQAIDWNGQHATMVSFRRAIDAEHGPRANSLDVELKARQAELTEARAMLDTATDGVISLDETGRILALNKSAEALFGYDQNELAGERLTLLMAPESHAAALDYIDGLKTGGVASVLNDGREVIGRERKGGRIPLFMTIGRISETSKFAAVVRDLTAWKRAEAELTEAKRAAERSSALKSDFLAKVSHEIRTPMNAIIGFAEVMRDERLGPIGTERYKEYLKDIHTSGEHVISLVNDLLDLSKIEAGRLELSFGSVDLNAIVSSCLGIMQPQSNRDRVIMRSQLSAKLPPVVADERSIRQIVLNLLSNASKFTEPGGQVIISTALTEAGEAVIRVRDTGVGMTETDIQAAMEPFRQLSNARGRGGTGLGLPLTKALVEANRATFLIKSKVREGTLVEIIFPPTRVLAE